MATPQNRRMNKDLARVFGKSAEQGWDDETYDVQILVSGGGQVHVVLDPNPFVAEDTPALQGDLLMPAGFIRNDADAVLTDLNGDRSYAAVDSAGRVKIRPLTQALDEVRAVPMRPSQRTGRTYFTGQAIWAGGAVVAFVMTPVQPGGTALYIQSYTVGGLDTTGTIASNPPTSGCIFATDGTEIAPVCIPPPVLAISGLGVLLGIAQAGHANLAGSFPEPAKSTGPPTLGSGPLGAPTNLVATIKGYYE